MAKLEGYSNLQAYFENLGLRKASTELHQLHSGPLQSRDDHSPGTFKHLHLSVKIFASIVIHEERECVRFPIELETFVQRSNVRSTLKRPHVIVFIERSLHVAQLNLLARSNLFILGK
jgi:hypothetical protein